MSDAGTQHEKATLTIGDKTAEFPMLQRHRRRAEHRLLDAHAADRPHRARLRVRQHRGHEVGDHLHRRRRRASCATAATRSSSSRRTRTYLEVAWLLIYGELPSRDRARRVRREDPPPHAAARGPASASSRRCRTTAHPMSVLSSAPSRRCRPTTRTSPTPHDPEQVELNTIRLLAKLPVIAAYAHKKSIGQAFLYPDNSLSFVDNFLKLNFGMLAEPYEVNPVMSQALERLLILHEDHEQNASTSTVRLVGSTEANLFASISAGINALYGPLHGGANEAVLDMLGAHPRLGRERAEFVERVKNKEDGVKLMGFGHRVYKNYDPRARLVKESADEVLEALGVHDPLLDLAKELEEVALADDYFNERRLYPNVDFYTGVIYKAMGFPTRMFTVLFAIGRLPGWLAHWREMQSRPADQDRPPAAAVRRCRAPRLPRRGLTGGFLGHGDLPSLELGREVGHIVLEVARRVVRSPWVRSRTGMTTSSRSDDAVRDAREQMRHHVDAAPPLVDRGDLEPGRLGDVGVDEHGVLRTRVVLPLRDRHHVVGRELPPAHRILGPRAEAPLLLDVRDAEPVLAQDDAVLHEHPLEDRRLVQEPVVLDVACRYPITCSTPARLYQERSISTISPAAGRCGDVALEVPLRPLPLGGRRQGDDPGHARVEVLRDPFDRGALARGIPSLEDRRRSGRRWPAPTPADRRGGPAAP